MIGAATTVIVDRFPQSVIVIVIVIVDRFPPSVIVIVIVDMFPKSVFVIVIVIVDRFPQIKNRLIPKSLFSERWQAFWQE